MTQAQPANLRGSVMYWAGAAALLPTVGRAGCAHEAFPLPTTPGAQHLASKRWADGAPGAECRRRQGPQRVLAAPLPCSMPITWPAELGMSCSQAPGAPCVRHVPCPGAWGAAMRCARARTRPATAGPRCPALVCAGAGFPGALAPAQDPEVPAWQRVCQAGSLLMCSACRVLNTRNRRKR